MRNQININRSLFKKGGRVLVALSGGADSVCLAHALASQSKEIGIEVGAAHFSHGIRPEAAEEELGLVSRLCRRLDIPLFTGHGDTPSYAKGHGLGLEEAARELRYDFLYRILDEHGYDSIATAHNLSDNSETIIFNLARGSGLSGLKGIPERNGRLLRPILSVSREEIEEYDREHGLEYAIDQTNSDERYTRNKVRLSIMPLVRRINGSADMAMLRAGRVLGETEDYMRHAAAQTLDMERENGEAPLGLLNQVHPALRYYICCRLFEEAGGSRLSLSYAHIDSLSRLISAGRVSSRISLPQGFEADITYGRLRIRKKVTDSPLPGQPAELEPGREIIWNGWHILIGGEKGTAFELESLRPPFIVRSRRQGDVIPMARGSRNIKKYLINKKISAEARDRIPLICDNKGVLLLGDLAKDGQRCYKNKGTAFRISCRRSSADDEGC